MIWDKSAVAFDGARTCPNMTKSFARAHIERADHVGDIVLIFDDDFVAHMHFEFARNNLHDLAAQDALVGARHHNIAIDNPSWFDDSDIGLTTTRDQPNSDNNRQQPRETKVSRAN